MAADAASVLRRCDELGAISEEAGRLTRRYGTPALAEARDRVAGWMREAGLAPRVDAIGNLLGRREGPAPGAPALLLGSHLDSVPDAGRYDGPLGVLTALAVADRLRDRTLPFALEVVAFADEEGTRFGSGYLGSSVLTGSFDPAALERRDADGVRLRDAVLACGGDPDAIVGSARAPGSVLAYAEVHIEQGPRLEGLGRPLAVVSSVTGQTRARLVLRGRSGHAGTTPMTGRRDALVAAARIVVAVEAAARAAGPEVVATVGELSVEPGASNVIPGLVRLSLDLRAPDGDVRRAAFAAVQRAVAAIVADVGVEAVWERVGQSDAVQCHPELTALLAEAAGGAPALPSGAGHDAAEVAALAPAVMLFVRCAGGISHAPEEAVAEADVAAALDALEGFCVRLAGRR